MSLAGNALKFTNKGSISVKLYTDEVVSSSGEESLDTLVTLQVRDTGPGMSREFVDTSLFTAFKQANSHAPGTGLGMSIVKEVAKDLNASVIVRSDLGQGTVVNVKFLSNFNHSNVAHAASGSALTKPTLENVPKHFRMLDLQEEGPQKDMHGARVVAESVLRTVSSWFECDARFVQDASTCPLDTVCAVSERDLLLLDKKGSDAVDQLISTLAGTCSRILVLSQSVRSVEPEFDFEDFPLKPLYLYQPSVAPLLHQSSHTFRLS